MMNLEGLLSPNLIKYYLIVSMGIAVGCSEKRTDGSAAARVGDSKLTEEEVRQAVVSGRDSNKYREEYIRRWVESELLYQEAVNERLVDDKNFGRLVEESKRNIAGAMLLEKELVNWDDDFDESEIENYYRENTDEFRLTSKAYLLNHAEFDRRPQAETFRFILLERGWDEAVRLFLNVDGVKIETGIFKSAVDILSPPIKRFINKINVNEVSVIIDEDSGKYLIIQVLRKFMPDEIPGYDVLKEKIIERLKIARRKIYYKKFIDDLYSKYEVKIY